MRYIAVCMVAALLATGAQAKEGYPYGWEWVKTGFIPCAWVVPVNNWTGISDGEPECRLVTELIEGVGPWHDSIRMHAPDMASTRNAQIPVTSDPVLSSDPLNFPWDRSGYVPCMWGIHVNMFGNADGEPECRPVTELIVQ